MKIPFLMKVPVPEYTAEIRPTAEVNPLVKVMYHDKPELASMLVWWLALMAGEVTKYRHPVVGDWVVESTHLVGTSRHKIGMLCAVGKLLKIEDDPEYKSEKVYTILTLEGKEQVWRNSKMYCLDDRKEIYDC